MRPIDVERGYDLWAPSYDTLDNPLVAMTDRAKARWRPTGRRVLEIGCGTGRHARYFLDHGVEAYVGVDLSAGMLAEARAKVHDPRASFLHGDATVAAEAGPFDGVFMSLVLEHLDDLAPVFEAAARAARVGAWLRILELHPDVRASGTRAHFHHEGEELVLPSHGHDVAELARAMAGAWTLVASTDWYADRTASAKLAKYVGRPVLLEVEARRGGAS